MLQNEAIASTSAELHPVLGLGACAEGLGRVDGGVPTLSVVVARSTVFEGLPWTPVVIYGAWLWEHSDEFVDELGVVERLCGCAL